MLDVSRARLITVCSGNICRSPMAAAQLRALCAARGAKPQVISMGTLNLRNRPAHHHAIAALAEVDIDLSDHRSQGLIPSLLGLADRVLVMTPMHAAEVVRVAKRARIVKLGDHAPTPLRAGIPDPVRGSLEDFRACRELLQQCLERWLAHEERA